MTLDYINLDLALSTICKLRCGEHHTPYDCGAVCEIVEALNALPVEALRPVIRCRECVHSPHNWEHDDLDMTDYTDITCDYWMSDGLTSNDYCSNARRKDGADNG